VLNAIANWLVRKAGAIPVDTLTVGHDPRSLRALVEHSAEAGTLDSSYHRSLDTALQLADRRVADLVDDQRDLTAVARDARVADLQRAAHDSGHLRVLVGRHGDYAGHVHVRDTLGADPAAGLDEWVRPLLEIEAETPMHEALSQMQDTSTHLAMVVSEGHVLGVVSINDILPGLLPR
jgi:CBS domain containing-hemolysin-like protein